ncbi:MAG: hypothetical protein H7X88_03795 [Gloeobacteraceae cyanobacterium ES-bin-316]|nr:hypothetical protein [Ferruginibacter sp.]
MEDLLQFIYKETSPEKTLAISTALLSDWSLREKMNILSAAHKELDTMELLSPRDQTLENIFNYAEKSVSELSENV